MCERGDDRDGRKVGPVAPAIPREQLQSGHRGVGADEEVGQGRDLGSLSLAVSQECFPSQERRFERDREPGNDSAGSTSSISSMVATPIETSA